MIAVPMPAHRRLPKVIMHVGYTRFIRRAQALGLSLDDIRPLLGLEGKRACGTRRDRGLTHEITTPATTSSQAPHFARADIVVSWRHSVSHFLSGKIHLSSAWRNAWNKVQTSRV